MSACSASITGLSPSSIGCSVNDIFVRSSVVPLYGICLSKNTTRQLPATQRGVSLCQQRAARRTRRRDPSGRGSEILRRAWLSRAPRAIVLGRLPLDEAVLARLLRLIQRLIGMRDQLACRRTPRDRHADAGRDPQICELAFSRPERLNPLTNTFGYRNGILGAAARHDDRELLAAEARAQVEFPHGSFEDVANAADHQVTGEVAVAIVDSLEIVDVDHQQRDCRLVTSCAIQFFLEPFVEIAPVEQATDR